jgi:hypothetical protein
MVRHLLVGAAIAALGAVTTATNVGSASSAGAPTPSTTAVPKPSPIQRTQSQRTETLAARSRGAGTVLPVPHVGPSVLSDGSTVQLLQDARGKFWVWTEGNVLRVLPPEFGHSSTSDATVDVFTVDGTGHVTQSEEHAGTGTWVFRPTEPPPSTVPPEPSP